MVKKKNAPVSSPTLVSAPASAGADTAKDKEQVPPPPPPRYYSFKYVVQCDFPQQMAVHDWLTKDPHFRVVWILHDKDTYSQRDAEEKPKQWKDGVHTRKNGDGSESQFRFGDIKPAHIHGYVRVQNKVTECTMKKRFGNYVTFDGVNDSYATLIYFTHADFVSQVIDKKHLYDESELRGDITMYKDNCKKISVTDNFGVMMLTYQEYVRKYGSRQSAVTALLRDGRLDVITDIRKNSGFYDRFLSGSRSECVGVEDEINAVEQQQDEPQEQQQDEPQEQQQDEPQEQQQDEPQEMPTLGIYGKNDCRNRAYMVKCVCCGRLASSVSFYKVFGKEGICGACKQH